MDWDLGLIMIFSAFLYSLQYLDIKTIQEYYSPWTVAFGRASSGTLCALSLMAFLNKRPFFGNNLSKLLLRGALGGASFLCAFGAVENLNLSTATVMNSLAPFYTAIYACQFLKEDKWHKYDSCGLVFCLSGLLMISFQGFMVSENPRFLLGMVYGMFSSLFGAAVNITISELKNEEACIISFYTMFIGLLMSVPGLIVEQTREPLEWTWSFQILQLFLTGFLSFSAQWLKTKAIKESKNLGVILFRYLDIVFCLIWDLSILHTDVSFLEGMGILLILLGCVLRSMTVTRKWALSIPNPPLELPMTVLPMQLPLSEE